MVYTFQNRDKFRNVPEDILEDRRRKIHNVCDIAKLSFATWQREHVTHCSDICVHAAEQWDHRAAVCSELKEQSKMTPTRTPSSLVINLGFKDTAPRRSSSHLNGRRQNSPRPKKAQSLNWHNNSDLTVWNWRHRVLGIWFQSSGATIPGPCTMTTVKMRPPKRHSLSSSFSLKWKRQPSLALPSHQTSLPVIFTYFRK
jgi:hypothetical protein